MGIFICHYGVQNSTRGHADAADFAGLYFYCFNLLEFEVIPCSLGRVKVKM